MSFTLRPDQIEDLGYFLNNPKALFLSEPGTGKTPVVNVLQRALWDEKNIASVWPMPDKLLEKNREEAFRFGMWSNPDDVVIARSEADFQKPARVFLTTFARFRMSWKSLPERVRAFQSDEHHKGFGGHASGQTQAMYSFMQKQGEWFLPMTGTLYNGKPDTCFPVLNVIEPRYYGNYDSFKAHHHVVDIFTGKTSGYQNLAHLQMLLALHARRRLWAEVHGDHKPVIQIEQVAMEPEQRSMYEELREKALLELERFFVDGTLPGVNFIRARQIMEHPNFFPDLTTPGQTVDISPGRRPGKLDLLDFHFENAAVNRKPLVVYATQIPQQQQIFEVARTYNPKIALLNGQTKERDIDEKFRRGEIEWIVASPLVADAGYNWQWCGDQEVDHAIFASLDFRDTTFIQAYRRFMREARKSALRITVLKYRNSLDDRIAYLVNRRSREAQLVDPTREILEL